MIVKPQCLGSRCCSNARRHANLKSYEDFLIVRMFHLLGLLYWDGKIEAKLTKGKLLQGLLESRDCAEPYILMSRYLISFD